MTNYNQEYEISFDNIKYEQQKENEKMRKLLDSVNLLSKQIPNIKPTEPNVGDVYRDPMTLTTKYYNGKGWNVIFSDEEAMKGTVSPPTYPFERDMDSGWYYMGDNKLGFVVDGMRVAGLDLTDAKPDQVLQMNEDGIKWISVEMPDWSVNPAHNNDGNFTITQDEREVLDPTYEKVESPKDLDDAYERAMKVL